MVRRIVTILAVVFTVMIATPTVAYGQTYGFDQTCNEIHDDLDGLGLPGVSLGDAASAIGEAQFDIRIAQCLELFCKARD